MASQIGSSVNKYEDSLSLQINFITDCYLCQQTTDIQMQKYEKFWWLIKGFCFPSWSRHYSDPVIWTIHAGAKAKVNCIRIPVVERLNEFLVYLLASEKSVTWVPPRTAS
mmetsp:Transcript_1374/g.1767  ORF Transcript_1374/g.1767 Transcript_1374/m.1767 type:complete len:110 (+) Transcript_1374:907-1236(+)